MIKSILIVHISYHEITTILNRQGLKFMYKGEILDCLYICNMCLVSINTGLLHFGHLDYCRYQFFKETKNLILVVKILIYSQLFPLSLFLYCLIDFQWEKCKKNIKVPSNEREEEKKRIPKT